MKILQVNTEKGWRGGERQTLFLLEGLRDRGAELALWAKADQPLAQKAAEAGFKVLADSPGLGGLLAFAKAARQFDWIHAQNSGGHTLAMLARPLHGRPVMYTRRVDFKPSGTLSRLKYRQTDQVVAISPAIARILEPILGRRPPVIGSAVKPITPNVNRVRDWLAERGVGVSVIVGVVAALVPHKDPLTAVRTAARLREIRSDFCFLHFGSGPLEAETRREIAKLGLEQHYVLAGFVPQVEDFYWAFNAFLMTSTEEGLGSGVLDAFMMRVPVVSTRAGGLADLLAEDRGLLAQPGDAQALAEALQQALTDTEGAAKRAERAFSHAQAEHRIDTTCERYWELFENLLRK